MGMLQPSELSQAPVSCVTWAEDGQCDGREGDWDLNPGCKGSLAEHGRDSESLSLKCVCRAPLAEVQADVPASCVAQSFVCSVADSGCSLCP